MTKPAATTFRLVQLASVILFFHVGHSILQEQVFHLPGFHHALLLSFLQAICVSIFACADYIRQGGERKTPFKYYIVISLLAVVASFATNEASLRLNYPTQVIFKSSKLLAVMFLRAAVMRHKTGKLTTMDIASAVTVVFGLAAFTYGTHQSKLQMKTISSGSSHDNHHHSHHHEDDLTTTAMTTSLSPSSSSNTEVDAATGFMFGVIAVVVAVAADAGLYIVEEKYCFHTFGSSNGEIIVFLNAFAAAHAGTALTLSGRLSESISFVQSSKYLLPLVVAYSLCNFIGTTAILSIISDFGSPSAIIVTNTRKVCTILGSFVVYPKPFTFLHGIGLLLVTGGVYAHELSRKKKKQKEIDDDDDNKDDDNKHRLNGDGGDQQQGNTSIKIVSSPNNDNNNNNESTNSFFSGGGGGSRRQQVMESSPMVLPPSTPA